jgi:hypothetical protein
MAPYPADQLLKTVETIVSPPTAPTFIDRVHSAIEQYPSIPKTLIAPVAFLATLAGWSVLLWMSIHVIVAMEVLTEWRVYKSKYKLTSREWTQKITNKLIAYISLALTASALSWVAVELKDGVKLLADSPQWVFMITPNLAGVWIIFAATQVIRDNLALLGFNLPKLSVGK